MNAYQKEEDEEENPSEESYVGVLQCPFTVLHPLHGSSDPYSLARTLEEVAPRYAILYDADMGFVRQLEVGSICMEVYLCCMYKDYI